MQIDKSTLERLQCLDDAALAETVRKLAASAGLPPSAIAAITQNLPALRMMLANTSAADLSRGLSMLGDARAAEMLRRMNGGK